MSVITSPGATAAGPRRHPSRWPAHWPITVLSVGFPLWWLLGVAELMAFAMAVPMAVHLRRRRVILPAGFGLWLLFLVWLLFSGFTLWAEAPGAVPGGGPGRLLVFGYRVAWYATCTVALLWAANLDKRELSVRRVAQLFGYMLVVTVAGGLLGVLAPTLEFRSAVELLLPASLAGNDFVTSIVHPNIAEIQTILGRPEARPTAPFAFANSWGSNLSMYLPFFLLAWFRGPDLWQRFAGPVVLGIAAVPIVYSLNRGLWASLALGVAVFFLRQTVRRSPREIAVTAAVAVLAAALFAASPLSELASERFANQHSNERRSQLLVQTVQSTAEASPVLGFGSTRDVQGSFASIAGGPTPDCPACGVPPLGTQGLLWLVIFSQGLLGAAFFLGFFAVALWRNLRCRTPIETVCTYFLLFFGLQLLIYDMLGMPLLTLMITIGLAWREQASRTTRRGTAGRTSSWLFRRLSRGTPAIALLAVVGAAGGAMLASHAPQLYSSRVSILLVPSPLYLAADAQGDTIPENITVDTEAALVFSLETMRQLGQSGRAVDAGELRERIRVTAEPSTTVLNIELRARTADSAAAMARALADAYLRVRGDYLAQRRAQILTALRDERLALETAVVSGPGSASLTDNATLSAEQERIDGAIQEITLMSSTAGEVIHDGAAEPVRRQYAVTTASGGVLGVGAGGVLALFGLAARRRRDHW